MAKEKTELYNKFEELLKNDFGYKDILEQGGGDAFEELMDYGTICNSEGKRIPGKAGRDLREREWDIAKLLESGEPIYIYKKGDKYPTKVQYNSDTGEFEVDPKPINEISFDKEPPEEPSFIWKFINLFPAMFGGSLPSVKAWRDYNNEHAVRENMNAWHRMERRRNYEKLIEEKYKAKAEEEPAKAKEKAKEAEIKVKDEKTAEKTAEVQQSQPSAAVPAASAPVPAEKTASQQLEELMAQRAALDKKIEELQKTIAKEKTAEIPAAEPEIPASAEAVKEKDEAELEATAGEPAPSQVMADLEAIDEADEELEYESELDGIFDEISDAAAALNDEADQLLSDEDVEAIKAANPPDELIEEDPEAEDLVDDEPDLDDTIIEDPEAEDLVDDEEPEAEILVDDEPETENLVDDEPEAENLVDDEPETEILVDDDEINLTEADLQAILDANPPQKSSASEPEILVDDDPEPEILVDDEPEITSNSGQGSEGSANTEQHEAPASELEILMDSLESDGTQLSDTAKSNLWQMYANAQQGKQLLEEAINNPKIERIAGGEAVQSMVAFKNLKTELSSGNKQQVIQNLNKEGAADAYQKITRISKDVVYAADYVHDKEFFKKNFIEDEGLARMAKTVDDRSKDIVNAEKLFGMRAQDPTYKARIEAEKLAKSNVKLGQVTEEELVQQQLQQQQMGMML